MNVWTGGTFDLAHPGHVHLLRQCRLIAGEGKVTVAVNADEFAGRFKAKPIQSLSERLEVISAFRYVDTTQVNFGGLMQRDLILQAQADFVVVGDDWADRDYLSQISCSPGFLADNNIKVIYVPRAFVGSSSELKARIRK